MGNAAPRAQPANSTQLDTASQCRTLLMECVVPHRNTMNLVFSNLLGDGKFLKTVQCKCEEGVVVVKIYRKYDAHESLESAKNQLAQLFAAINSVESCPNLIPYSVFEMGTKANAAFLVRQYFVANLYDRIYTRPFLTDIEKKWIAFQLLKALEQSHSRGIYHGDIKQENVMVTSWNWIFLTDFAPFKPTYIPEDDPADYYYYFCASDASRRSCSVAPERFYGSNTDVLSRLADSEISAEEWDKQMSRTPPTGPTATMAPSPANQTPKGTLTEAMDIFSTGCVIAELFNGGKPLFDLPTLLRYRTGDMHVLSSVLNKFQDAAVSDMVRHMLQRDPRNRFSAAQYRQQYTDSIFPAYFDSFLFRFMALVLSRGGKLPDARIRLVCKYYARIVRELVGVEDREGEIFFNHRLKEGHGSDRAHFTDDVIQRMYDELDGAEDHQGVDDNDDDDANEASFTKHPNAIPQLQATYQTYAKRKHETLKKVKSSSTPSLSAGSRLPPNIPRPNGSTTVPAAAAPTSSPPAPTRRTNDEDDDIPEKPKAPATATKQPNGIMIVLSLLCSSLRHCHVPQSKLTGLQLISRLGAHADDEVRLQRLIPYVMEVLDDANAAVRAAAIRCITSLVSLVTLLPLSDAAVFPQYILPSLQNFPVDPEESVRIAFAECLPLLAETSRRFLEISCALKQRALHAPSATETARGLTTTAKKTKEGRNLDTTFSTFDNELNRLHSAVARFVIQIAAPDQKTSSSLVKRALLHDITRLCVFFGREYTLDNVLPLLLSFLNDRDWELRAAFFQDIPGVCTFVGRVSAELYILPCIEQALIDVQEIVIARALHCLATLCSLGLFQRPALIDKAKLTAPLLLHPGWWIREANIQLIASISVQLGSVDTHVFLMPLLYPYMRRKIKFTPDEADLVGVLRSALQPPVPREAFDAALIARNPMSMQQERQVVEADHSQSMHEGEYEDLIDTELQNTMRRVKLASEDSLDGYSPGNNLRSHSTRAIDRYEKMTLGRNFPDDSQRLKLMQQYIEMASMHMQSKIQLFNSEQVARMQSLGPNPSKHPLAFTKKIPRSALHSLRIPTMPVALSQFSLSFPFLKPKQGDGGVFKWESLPLSHIIRIYGLYTGLSGLSDTTTAITEAEVLSNAASPSRKKALNAAAVHDMVLDPALFHTHKLLARLMALDIPPMPMDMGAVKPPEYPSTQAAPVSNPVPTATIGSANAPPPLLLSSSSSYTSNRDWRPRENVMVAELSEHSGPVNRIGVAPDGSFLASASTDGTVKIWSVKGLAHGINPSSRGTYEAQGGLLTDMVVCQHSHSIATSSSNGSVHVFRVDRVSSAMSNSMQYHTLGLREMKLQDDSVLVLNQINTATECLLIYGTRRGFVYGWDLRFRREAWKLHVSVELGHITCMTHSSDATWLAVGTNRGYICLWDLRYQLLIRVWRHSSNQAIHRLEPCLSGYPAGQPELAATSPLVYVAAGDSEAAVFDLSIGACRAVFRTLHTQVQMLGADKCPTLHHVQVPSRMKDVMGSILGPPKFAQALDEVAATPFSEEPSIRAMVCPSEFSLLTAGEDRRIRFWDLRHPKKSLTVSGGDTASFYDSQDAPPGWWRLNPEDSTEKVSKAETVWSKMSPPSILLCQDASSFGEGNGDGYANPALERRGPIAASPAHHDCILDLKMVDVNGPMIVSSARDGVIKVWR
ncbi:Aste57867_10903 [Aphanomyces stellatus]|uniref:non-specific serine/threonine protein kinase n=1 Tax=Aphanomyces stellatus TaxID=120398 RepID=A0A485KRP4_9STRA|nr:hypothetical protein As57867_010863 [Aphanomyces stellatus]VFT87771.1 Aste57867_10903 [Aphanomyces stellatus]